MDIPTNFLLSQSRLTEDSTYSSVWDGCLYSSSSIFFEVHYLPYTYNFTCKYTQIFLNLYYLIKITSYTPKLFRL